MLYPAHEDRLYYAQTRIHYGNAYRRPSDYYDNYNRMKIILKNQLAQAQIPNMPAGFPLHYTADGHGSAFLSEGSYEFRYNLPSSSIYGSYPESGYVDQAVVFSFSDPFSSTRSGRDRGKYVWRISLPTFESNNHPDAQVTSAEVQVDMAIMRSAFGDRIRYDSRIIYKALAISLEYGMKINIALADYSSIASLTKQSSKRCIVAPGDVVYLASDTNGQQQLVNVLDRAGFYAKFSANPKFPAP
ncbi:hypothetical protein NMY22_g788 [Coprinellus aureogranulatus]|nr:hypothetical protein NMY22_g788 [Coprinellus aureogranulatus]